MKLEFPVRDSAMRTARDLVLGELGPTALDQRFRRPLMIFFQRRVQSHAEAEDLTQQVFLRLVGAGERREVADPAAFVFQIAANLLRDRYRAATRRGDEVSLPEEALVAELHQAYAGVTTPEQILLAKDSLAHALRSLDELGERTRDMFILFKLENMKQPQIAALYGCSISTVEKQIMKATLHLAVRYGRP